MVGGRSQAVARTGDGRPGRIRAETLSMPAVTPAGKGDRVTRAGREPSANSVRGSSRSPGAPGFAGARRRGGTARRARDSSLWALCRRQMAGAVRTAGSSGAGSGNNAELSDGVRGYSEAGAGAGAGAGAVAGAAACGGNRAGGRRSGTGGPADRGPHRQSPPDGAGAGARERGGGRIGTGPGRRLCRLSSSPLIAAPSPSDRLRVAGPQPHAAAAAFSVRTAPAW